MIITNKNKLICTLQITNKFDFLWKLNSIYLKVCTREENPTFCDWQCLSSVSTAQWKKQKPLCNEFIPCSNNHSWLELFRPSFIPSTRQTKTPLFKTIIRSKWKSNITWQSKVNVNKGESPEFHTPWKHLLRRWWSF